MVIAAARPAPRHGTPQVVPAPAPPGEGRRPPRPPVRTGGGGASTVSRDDRRAPRDELLARLRAGSGNRPRVSPSLAGGLRAWLEDAAAELVIARGEGAPPLFLGPRLVEAALPRPPEPRHRPVPTSIDTALSCLVHVVFRHVASIGPSLVAPSLDPGDVGRRRGALLDHALAALSVDPARGDVVALVHSFDDGQRRELAEALHTHVEHLCRLTPQFVPSWLPRTDDRVSIPLAGGRIMLTGVFDLLVGAPVPDTATVCALGVSAGGRWQELRAGLHYLALLETLRTGCPPFRLALIHSGVGRYDVEDVRSSHLVAMTEHVATVLGAMAGRGA